MEQKLELYYEREVRSYEYPPPYYRYERRRNIYDSELIDRTDFIGFTQFDTIKKAILIFEKDLSKNWILRNDAKLLLYINFDKLVYRPLSKIIPQEELNTKIFSDVIKILESSKQMKSSENKESQELQEISSHDILKSGMEIWNNLETISAKTWF